MNPTAAILAAIANLTQQIAGLSNQMTVLTSARGIEGGEADTVYDLHDLLSLVEQNTYNTFQAVENKGGLAGGKANEKEEKEGGKAGGVGDMLGQVFNVALAKITLILAPLVGLAAVIGSVTSGIQPLLTTFRIFAGVLGSFLMPVFVLLAAAVLAASDELFTGMLPVLEDWYTFVANAMIPALEAFVSAVRDAVTWLAEFAKDPAKKTDEAIQQGAPGYHSYMQEWGDVFGAILYGAGSVNKNGVAMAPPPGLDNKTPNTPAPPAAPSPATGDRGERSDRGERGGGADNVAPPVARPSARQRFRESLDLVMESVARSVGPQASMGSVNDLNRKAQEAVFKTDPLQQKQEEQFRTVVQLFMRVISNTDRKAEPVHKPPEPPRRR